MKSGDAALADQVADREDDVHLGADGPELLTHFTRELLELA